MIPEGSIQQNKFHSGSVAQFSQGKSPMKDLKVPKKENKLNYQFKNQQ
jgi:hypothetical protein